MLANTMNVDNMNRTDRLLAIRCNTASWGCEVGWLEGEQRAFAKLREIPQAGACGLETPLPHIPLASRHLSQRGRWWLVACSASGGEGG
jgi:hypothetical protein